MSTRPVSAILGAIALCGTVAFAQLAPQESNETSERRLVLGKNGTVSIKSANGPIEIRAADGNQVVLRAVKRGTHTYDLEQIGIEIDDQPGEIRITTQLPKGCVRRRFENCDPSVAYELRVPRDASVEGSRSRKSEAT